MPKPTRFLLALTASAALLAACSDSPCEEYGKTLCEKACACTDGPGCTIAQGGVTISFDTESDCKGFYVTFGCSGDSNGFDFEGCTAALDDAMCVDTGDGTQAIEHPMCDMGSP